MMAKRNRQRRGLTLAELLAAVTITAMLMAAVAGAMHACFQTYAENDRIASMTQTGRAILWRMGQQLRTAQAVSYEDGLLTIIPPDGNASNHIKYELDDGELIYTLTTDGNATEHTLIASTDNVKIESFTMSKVMGVHSDGNTPCVKSLTTEMTLSAGENKFEITSTTSPRRNLTY